MGRGIAEEEEEKEEKRVEMRVYGKGKGDAKKGRCLCKGALHYIPHWMRKFQT